MQLCTFQAECICILKLCRFEASSILPPYRRVLTPYRRVLTPYCRVLPTWVNPLPSRPFRFRCIASNGRQWRRCRGSAAAPRAHRSVRVRRLPRGLFRWSLPESAVAAVAVCGGRCRRTAVQTISAHPADVQIVEDFLGILKWQWHNQTHAEPLPRASSLTL